MRTRLRETGRAQFSVAQILLTSALAVAAAWGGVALRADEKLPRPTEVVEPRTYVSLEPVPRGRVFELAVVAKIRPGFHINAHKATEEYLISTTLEVKLPAGVQLLDTVYPPGELKQFGFSDEKLRVYDGSVTLRMKLRTAPDAPLGMQNLSLELRYQACNDSACLPPAKLPVTAQLEIAPANVRPRSAHPEIFSLLPHGAQKPH